MRRLLLVALAALLALSAAPIRAEDDPAAETLALLSATDLPQRDRFALARWYLGVRELPEPRSEPTRYRVGDTKVFETYNLDTDTRFSFTARLALISRHAYWWFEEGYTPNMEALRRSAERFDSVIYPTVRAHFGSEDSPGIDAIRAYSSSTPAISAATSPPISAAPTSSRAPLCLRATSIRCSGSTWIRCASAQLATKARSLTSSST